MQYGPGLVAGAKARSSKHAPHVRGHPRRGDIAARPMWPTRGCFRGRSLREDGSSARAGRSCLPLCLRGPQKVSGALVDARQVDSWHLATSLTTLSPPRSLGPSLVWAPEEPGTQGAVYGRGKLWSPCSPTSMQPHILVRLEHHAHSPPPQDLALRLPLPADPCPGSPCTQSLSPGPHSELFLPWARTTWPPSPPGDTAVLLP